MSTPNSPMPSPPPPSTPSGSRAAPSRPPPGIAYRLGWLDEEFARDGIALKTLQETGGELARHHYDHELTTLGAPTRLVGLTWIDEFQAILVRPDSDISRPEHLRGKRLALPAFPPADIEQNRRGAHRARHEPARLKGALNSAGLSLDDAQLVELPPAPPREGDLGHLAGGPPQRAGQPRRQDLGTGLWEGIHPPLRGEVDPSTSRAPRRLGGAARLGAKIGIDLDQLPEKKLPRQQRHAAGAPHVHQSLIDDHFELLVRFLTQTLRAAEADPRRQRRRRRRLSQRLPPDARAGPVPERVELFRQQKHFQLTHGFLDRDFDFDAWIDPRPLAARASSSRRTGRRRLARAAGLRD
ncbi:hypothetical protein Ddc_20089 [Ditylenchus destructor]|nr:hypothetical protein Ddc_20089 [Ditylenchus destructor]